MDHAHLIAARAARINGSGIRHVFDRVEKARAAGRTMLNLGIGQPDFPVPANIKQAAIDAINGNQNGYMPTSGMDHIRQQVAAELARETGWAMDVSKQPDPAKMNLMITVGTSGALALAMQAIVNPGDEVIIPDPYFVLYPLSVELCEGKAVKCDTYPDFRLTASRVEKLITPRTKAVLLNSPGNPSGVVMSQKECDDLAALCAERKILLISDEIYDKFTFSEGLEHGKFPTPCRSPKGSENVLLIRGFGKTYGVTGWRLGYAAGPRQIVDQIVKLQQYSFVCAPAPLQAALGEAMKTDMSEQIAMYRRRRDIVLKHLSPHTECTVPAGAFYVFVKVPEHLGMSGRQFYEAAFERDVVVIPGDVFSNRGSHFRISYTIGEEPLEKACVILADIMRKR
jgi:aspartate/methionine/tyrosine aminotransferase